jgi:hypothetical protein
MEISHGMEALALTNDQADSQKDGNDVNKSKSQDDGNVPDEGNSQNDGNDVNEADSRDDGGVSDNADYSDNGGARRSFGNESGGTSEDELESDSSTGGDSSDSTGDDDDAELEFVPAPPGVAAFSFRSLVDSRAELELLNRRISYYSSRAFVCL